jgi:predicted  nucleic acid-binding Zn-ribbon protein
VERDNEAYNREIDEYKRQRNELVEALHFDAVRAYDKVKSARDGAAVVSADGNTCGGCFMTVTANDIARLRGMNQLVMCKHCQRILYLSDMLN